MLAAAVWTTASTLVEPVEGAAAAIATVSVLKRREKDKRWSGDRLGSTQATSATGRGWSGREWRVVGVGVWRCWKMQRTTKVLFSQRSGNWRAKKMALCAASFAPCPIANCPCLDDRTRTSGRNGSGQGPSAGQQGCRDGFACVPEPHSSCCTSLLHSISTLRIPSLLLLVLMSYHATTNATTESRRAEQTCSVDLEAAPLHTFLPCCYASRCSPRPTASKVGQPWHTASWQLLLHHESRHGQMAHESRSFLWQDRLYYVTTREMDTLP